MNSAKNSPSSIMHLKQFSIALAQVILDYFGFALPLLCDWSRKIVPLAQSIKCKTKTNSNSVTRVFPRFKLVGCFYHEVSLANDDVSL